MNLRNSPSTSTAPIEKDSNLSTMSEQLAYCEEILGAESELMKKLRIVTKDNRSTLDAVYTELTKLIPPNSKKAQAIVVSVLDSKVAPTFLDIDGRMAQIQGNKPATTNEDRFQIVA